MVTHPVLREFIPEDLITPDPWHQDMHPDVYGAATVWFNTPMPLRALTLHTAPSSRDSLDSRWGEPRTPTLARRSRNNTHDAWPTRAWGNIPIVMVAAPRRARRNRAMARNTHDVHVSTAMVAAPRRARRNRGADHTQRNTRPSTIRRTLPNRATQQHCTSLLQLTCTRVAHTPRRITALIQHRAQISSGSAPDLPRLPGLHCQRA